MFQTYAQAMDWLLAQLPMFTRIGAAAYKPGIGNIVALCEALGNPHLKYPVVHIAGTNGKGSSSHSIASVLQEAGYKTGLHTSPHLKKFNERIRINGIEWTDDQILQFINTHQTLIEEIKPSYFEVSVAMAFYAFAQEEVDIAVIETGLGGRLDSTNIVSPVLSLITNIGWDHTDLLGDTLPKIAAEKAGIIKPYVLAIVSTYQEECATVFIQKAEEVNAPLAFAKDHLTVKQLNNSGLEVTYGVNWSDGSRMVITSDLTGGYQIDNIPGILLAIKTLQDQGFEISADAIASGLANVKANTGLKGRWQILNEQPLTIADTGHNKDGLKQVFTQLQKVRTGKLYIVLGMMADKDFEAIKHLFPSDALYLTCAPNTPRALPANLLTERLLANSLEAITVGSVGEAYEKAKYLAAPTDTIFIGGSTFVVAEIPDL
jgi:dihydrofolate synthase/folylpolyglutamate synthase